MKEDIKIDFNVILLMALEYRLSLKGICKLLNMDVTIENTNKIYNMIVDGLKLQMEQNKTKEGNNSNSKMYELYEMFNYLCNETNIESKECMEASYNEAKLFFVRYTQALRLKREDLLNPLLSRLYKTENDFSKVKKQKNYLNNKFTEEEIIKISKYRIKHTVSKENMANVLGVCRDKLHTSEEGITDKVLKERLNKLNEYNFDIGYPHRKRRASI